MGLASGSGSRAVNVWPNVYRVARFTGDLHWYSRGHDDVADLRREERVRFRSRPDGTPRCAREQPADGGTGAEDIAVHDHLVAMGVRHHVLRERVRHDDRAANVVATT